MQPRNVYLRIPDDLHHRARVLATTRRITVNDIYAIAMEEYLSRTMGTPSAPQPLDRQPSKT